jgi:hypothetical protein
VLGPVSYFCEGESLSDEVPESASECSSLCRRRRLLSGPESPHDTHPVHLPGLDCSTGLSLDAVGGLLRAFFNPLAPNLSPICHCGPFSKRSREKAKQSPSPEIAASLRSSK